MEVEDVGEKERRLKQVQGYLVLIDDSCGEPRPVPRLTTLRNPIHFWLPVDVQSVVRLVSMTTGMGYLIYVGQKTCASPEESKTIHTWSFLHVLEENIHGMGEQQCHVRQEGSSFVFLLALSLLPRE